MDIEIHAGDKVPIEATVQNAALAPLTGKTDILVSVRKIPGDYFLDWSDMTFKASGWTTRLAQMTEVDSTLSPGDYRKDFDTADLDPVNATFAVTIEQSPGTDAANLPQKAHIRMIGAHR